MPSEASPSVPLPGGAGGPFEADVGSGNETAQRKNLGQPPLHFVEGTEGRVEAVVTRWAMDVERKTAR